MLSRIKALRGDEVYEMYVMPYQLNVMGVQPQCNSKPFWRSSIRQLKPVVLPYILCYHRPVNVLVWKLTTTNFEIYSKTEANCLAYQTIDNW